MRVKNTRPTLIYWLIDIRPETIAAGWSSGLPFYCGKTVATTRIRLGQHRCQAASKPHGKVGIRVVECGEFIRVQTMEVVPSAEDWTAREKFWIATMRLLYPGCCLNVTDGGEGPVGHVQSAETLVKKSIALRGLKRTPETCERLRKANLGKILTPEHRAKLSISHLGKTPSVESRAKTSAALMGIKRPPMSAEHREKNRLAHLGKKQTPEAIAKRVAANTGLKRSPEARARMSSAQQLRFGQSAHV